ncbi:ABC transporter [Lactobacillus nasalidis]|uniref:ABC transporter n=1 Tax=Lactobacillus nasalidis TaxID=2797258 RepID=A0ABQ3W6G3_9LACO|nr:ABC transporter ATP-binding protein [Lactobacillus nasalidis]GHV98425.1 ABC transporter [Lactobacillus nasalidis]GHV98806.1 ABC transporter [Lactobacillus nasalidis]GHW01152.1 ABC transporter [Lactobacillus nasalidis]
MPKRKLDLASNRQTMKEFIAYLGRYKFSLIFAIIVAIAGSLLNVWGPSKLSEITNLISAGLTGRMNTGRIMTIGAGLVLIYVIAGLCNILQSWKMSTITQTMTRQMRQDISEKINRVPLRYFDSHATGDTLSRVTNDVDTIGQMMNQSISNLVSSVAMLIGVIVMMLITNWVMALAGMITAVLGFLLSSGLVSSSQRYYNKQQQTIGVLNGKVEESYTGLAVVKAYNGEQQIGDEFKQLNDSLFEYAWKSNALSGSMNPIMQFFGNAAYVVVCVVGAVAAHQGQISFGTIVAFMVYIRLFSEPLQNLGQMASSLEMMTAAAGRVFEFLNEEEMGREENKLQLDRVKGSVEFKDVVFGYNYPDQVIVNDFNASVAPGEKVALVGPTGAGKTTIVNLLMRFYEINSGSIKIDGVSTKDITRENVHDLFGMVLQDTWLFAGNLRENLVYNQTGVSDQRLNEVCSLTGLSDLVKQLPNGYDTVIKADDLSAGQKQLITIARAMIKDAPLLILDEATSSVDTRTELKVQAAMDKLMEGRTSFVIAHRLSTIRDADMILVINHGDIVETGTHEELLAKGGFYANLYNSQFEDKN